MPCAQWKRRHVLPASTAKGCASRGLLLTALAKLNEASCCQDGRQLGRLSVSVHATPCKRLAFMAKSSWQRARASHAHEYTYERIPTSGATQH